MKKQTIRYTVLTLLTFTSALVYAFGNSDFPKEIVIKKLPKINSIEEEKNALIYLNVIRESVGLNRLSSNSKLNLASSNHATYLLKNNKIGHSENSNHEFYTGKFASNRSVFAGYENYMVIENISRNNFTHQESIDGLMGAIYHRFGFLNFHIDEIGIAIKQDVYHRNSSAFVYNMGSHILDDLCIEASEKPNNKVEKPMHNILCAESKIKVEFDEFLKVSDKYKDENTKVAKYPFDGQRDIAPVFYEEIPDPLPNHSVSGFPVSISFDSAYVKSVKILEFKLYDEEYNEVKETLFYDHKLDPNQQLTKFQFVLFPLKRLNWASDYHVEVKYIIDGVAKTEQWSFETKKFSIPIYTVTSNSYRYKIAKGEENIFYFPPLSERDILGDLLVPFNLEVSFIDKNTIKLMAKETLSENIILKMGKHELVLEYGDFIN